MAITPSELTIAGFVATVAAGFLTNWQAGRREAKRTEAESARESARQEFEREVEKDRRMAEDERSRQERVEAARLRWLDDRRQIGVEYLKSLREYVEVMNRAVLKWSGASTYIAEVNTSEVASLAEKVAGLTEELALFGSDEVATLAAQAQNAVSLSRRAFQTYRIFSSGGPVDRTEILNKNLEVMRTQRTAIQDFLRPLIEALRRDLGTSPPQA